MSVSEFVKFDLIELLTQLKSLKHCYSVISENFVKFDKHIAENIKIFLSVCE